MGATNTKTLVMSFEENKFESFYDNNNNDTSNNDQSVFKSHLYKKGEYNKKWRERYFVLYNDRKLSWFEKEEDYKQKKNPKNFFDLNEVIQISPIPTLKQYEKSLKNKRKNSKNNNKDTNTSSKPFKK